MPARTIIATLCDDVLELKSGKHCLIGLFDRFSVSDFRKPLPTFRIFVQIGFESSGEHRVAVQFRRSEGQVLFTVVSSVQIDKASPASQLYVAVTNLRFESLTLPGPGLYEFSISGDDQNLIVLPVDAHALLPPVMQ